MCQETMTFGLLKSASFLIIILLFSSLYYLYIFYSENIPHPKRFSVEYAISNEADKSFSVHTPGCRIPVLNPFDATVRRFYKKTPSTFDCGPKSQLFLVKDHGIVSVNETTLLKQHKVYLNETDCYFYPITRKYSGRKPDDTFILGKEHAMIFGLPIDDDFILLKCKKGNQTFARSVLALTPIKKTVEEKRENAEKSNYENQDKLSVVIVGIDSVSKLNFLRYFSKTLHLLRHELSAIELNGFTKVADNTYPNLIPFLTGHHRNYYKPLERRFSFYDDVDFVWKKYGDIGYRTLFSEDAPNMGAFVLNRRGFKNPPTDYYSRPFSIAVESLNMRHKSHCIGPTLEMKVYFDYLRNFASTMGEKPIFTFTFIARLTHDVLKYAGYADKPAYDLIKDLDKIGIFNRSLFIFFSDHGIRFGDIRQTYIGKIEERMPFMFLVFPDWFLKKHVMFSKNLHINSNRLTTPYDIHATLLHLLEPKKRNFFTLYGQSLFTEISPERNCADANIAKHWCVCQSHKAISTEDVTVRKAAMAVIKHLNKLLASFSRVCATLKMDKILDARMSQPNEEFLEKAGKDYLITLLVIPSNAIFEATVQVKNRQLKVSDEVSRLNIYGDESNCVQDNIIKKYCYCKALLQHS